MKTVSTKFRHSEAEGEAWRAAAGGERKLSGWIRKTLNGALSEGGGGSEGTDPGTPGVRLRGTAVPPSEPSSESAPCDCENVRTGQFCYTHGRTRW